MRSTRHVLAAAALAIAAVVTGTPQALVAGQAADADAARVTLAEFKKLADKDGVIVLDIRGDEAYKAGHIPGSLSVPLETIQSRAGEWKGAKKPIVTYCS